VGGRGGMGEGLGKPERKRMAGHSKWANIKHKKALVDAKKGKIFSKMARELTVAARVGGSDTASNITLRTLVTKARQANMPSDNIERAIKKGAGELDDGSQYVEIVYEGYAPGGVAVVVMVLTDNRNRSAGEVRFAFSKADASLSGQGSVTRSFQRKGVITISGDAISEEALMELALEAGADDMEVDGDVYTVTTDPAKFHEVLECLQSKDLTPLDSEISMVPDLWALVTDVDAARKISKFVEALEELDDVQNVYTNMDVSEEVAAQLAGE